MGIFQPKDGRGYFMLPQAPEGAGYYVYGNVNDLPGTGHLGQFAHPNLMTVILRIEREWQAICDRKFGIGNISVAGGAPFPPHHSHMSGAEVDCRPIRKDRLTGQSARCTYMDRAHYDLGATIELIRLFYNHPWVSAIFFNDPAVRRAVPGVASRPGHNDHFHVQLRKTYAS
jgi:penicillin-insensitive murein endopeptidase